MEFHTDRKQFKVDIDLLEICEKILKAEESGRDWVATENSDEYQLGNLCGGFEAIEDAFCFSYYSDDEEFWFQFSIEQAKEILAGRLQYLEMRLAD